MCSSLPAFHFLFAGMLSFGIFGEFLADIHLGLLKCSLNEAQARILPFLVNLGRPTGLIPFE